METEFDSNDGDFDVRLGGDSNTPIWLASESSLDGNT